MKIGLYDSPFAGTDYESQINTTRSHGIDYLSALSGQPVSAIDWKGFMTPPAGSLHGINLWRFLAVRSLHFSVYYKPAVDQDGVDWQQRAIEMAHAQGCAPHDLYAGHEVGGKAQSWRQSRYEEIKSKYLHMPVRFYYAAWRNALTRPRQKTAEGIYWVDCLPNASRRECDLAGLVGIYYHPDQHGYMNLQTDSPGEVWTRVEMEQAHACQMPYSRMVVHLNVVKEWLLENEEYRLTLRQFQRDLRGDGRYAVLMWRVLKLERCEPFKHDKRILPGPSPQGDWSPDLWAAIGFISAP